MAKYELRQTFTVSATAGAYAAEKIALAGGAVVRSLPLDAVTALVESVGTAAGAVTELWLLKVGGDPTADADYFLSSNTLTGVGGTSWPLASWRGAQLRVKSAGAAGSVVVSAMGD